MCVCVCIYNYIYIYIHIESVNHVHHCFVQVIRSYSFKFPGPLSMQVETSFDPPLDVPPGLLLREHALDCERREASHIATGEGSTEMKKAPPVLPKRWF